MEDFRYLILYFIFVICFSYAMKRDVYRELKIHRNLIDHLNFNVLSLSDKVEILCEKLDNMKDR